MPPPASQQCATCPQRTRRELNHQAVPASSREPLDYTAAELGAQGALGCTPREAFTNINFDAATLVASNLGGQGGRCVDTCYSNSDGSQVCFSWQSLCAEQTPVVSLGDALAGPMGNMHVLLRNMGNNPFPGVQKE